MSDVIISGSAISNNSLNHSTSKQMFSFGKEQRFHRWKKTTSAQFLFDIPSKASKRGAYIGYGNKSDFTKGKKYNVSYYNILKSKDSIHPNTPRYTFGISRGFYKKVVVSGKISDINKWTPGPGKYNYLKPFGSHSPKYTMVKRYNLSNWEGRVNSPGPARYTNNININPQGKYTLSRFTNSPRSGWSLSHVERFDYHLPKTPGAGSYNLEEMINGKGTIYNSRYRSAVSNSIFNKYKSIFDSRSITPGPGAYQTFSEFGIYKGKKDEYERELMNKTVFSNLSLKKRPKLSSPLSTRSGSFMPRKTNSQFHTKINGKFTPWTERESKQ